MEPVRVIVGGASGLIGKALTTRLRGDGHVVTALVRRDAGPGESRWDPASRTIDAAGLEGADAVVNMAGAGIADRRWSPDRKAILVDSRVGSTSLLASTLGGLTRPPKVLVNASAIGIYGERGEEELTEESDPGTGFLAGLCQRWEEATARAVEAGIRVVNLRTGIVLAPRGGALGRQLPLFRAALGGRLGTGRQWTSWISLEDEIGIITRLLGDAKLAGPVNAVAPEPVRNSDFTAALGRAVHRPTVFAVPATALRLAFGPELTSEAILASQRVLPSRLAAAGHRFRHSTVDEALRSVIGPGP